MPLAHGTRIGPYEIIAPLGAGGMGEVYRARDSRLNRDVALKALPDGAALDADRAARFDREAQILASLNHPHIAAIYGLEEAAAAQFIVLELVEGGTLADRLRSGALPATDALRIARDIADALEAAHEKGIIHRDLKPGNIALTSGGRPKVLDFGLAKAFNMTADDVTMAGVTQSGIVLGTAPYMSPEQARGLNVDKRSDIWSFGCVLYEMLTGRYPFPGTTASDIIAGILQREPDFDALPAATPARVRWLLRRCLEKDPKRRLHDIADARIEIEEALARPEPPSGAVVAAAPARGAITRERLAWVIAAVSLASLTMVAFLKRDRAVPPSAGEVYRSEIVLPENLQMSLLDPASRFAISPDGKRLAFVASTASGGPMLWVRPLDSLGASPLSGTEGALYPTWSPDSQSIAFLSRPASTIIGLQGKLKRVDIGGGQPVSLADISFTAGLAWSRDGVILFTPTGSSPLFKVQAFSGGAAVPATQLDAEGGEIQHSYPVFLPDGRHFLYSAIGTRKSANDVRAQYVAAIDGSMKPRVVLEEGTNPKYANGHLVFLRGGGLFGQPFDLDALQLHGNPFPLAERLQMEMSGSSAGTAAFSVSETGLLVYQAGAARRSQLAWVNRAGRMQPVGQPADYNDVTLSPDGTRAAVSILDPQIGTRDIWILDVVRGSIEKFTSEPSDDMAPVWSPQGDRLVFTSSRNRMIDMFERRLDGGGERMLDTGGSPSGKFAAHSSPDGRWLIYILGGRAVGRSDLYVLPMNGGKPMAFLDAPAVETQARFSPDGRWVTYTSNESGTLQVYVRPYPGPGDKQRVSLNGGSWALWSREGNEIFFLSPEGNLMSVAVEQQGGGLKLGDPKVLCPVRIRPMTRLDAYPYDVVKGADRFLFNTALEQAVEANLTLVVNWPAAARK